MDSSSMPQSSTTSPILFLDAITSTPMTQERDVATSNSSILAKNGTSESMDVELPLNLQASAFSSSSILLESDVQTNPLDTTVSNIQNKRVRKRKSTKWIATFQIMDPSNNTVQPDSNGTFPVTDAKSIEKIDEVLKSFFKDYNNHGKVIRKKNTEVCFALGGRYIFHEQINLVAGIVVIETQMCDTPQFDCHLLIEKSEPNVLPAYGHNHKITIGHAYPIHTSDVSCIGGNSLRSLLGNWVEPEETFFESLHWVIPPSTNTMRKLNPKEAELRDEEALLDFIELIREMKKVLLTSYRENLDQIQNEPLPQQQQQSTNASMFEFINIREGSEYRVKSHHWHTIQIPMDKNGKMNYSAYRAVTNIKRKGGIVKPVSSSD